MNRALFESFYHGTIEVIAKKTCEKDPEFQYTANLNGVFEEYLNQIALFRAILKNSASLEQDDRPLLDCHKVAACMTIALVNIRLITCDKINDECNQRYILENSNRMNEQVAVFCGVSCLLQYMLDRPKNMMLIGSEIPKMQWPETDNNGHPPYISSLVRALYYTNILSNINPLLLAHIFFLLEKHHRLNIAIQNSGVIIDLED